MQDIVLIGLNHNTAPVELRECMAFTSEDVEAALARLSDNALFDEVLLLSTCNRVEVLLVSARAAEAIKETKSFLSAYNGLPIERFDDSLYVYRGEEAVRHVFRVASSLDSMILGDQQRR